MKYYVTLLLLGVSISLSADSASDRAYQNRQADKAHDQRQYDNRQTDNARDQKMHDEREEAAKEQQLQNQTR